jgi:hypothetical protein
MQTESTYLSWQYLIFVAPACAAGLLLLLSALHLGGHHTAHTGHHGAGGGLGGHHGGASAAHHPGGTGGAAAHQAHSGAAAAKTGHVGRAGGQRTAAADRGQLPLATSFLFSLLGIGRAPFPLVAEMFALCWGTAGFAAVQAMVPWGTLPSGGQMVPALGVALAGGLVGGRISAEIMARLMPHDESTIISRNGLFGLIGEVVYPVSASGGRIHVYDEFGTMHDESCRTAPNQNSIPKGHHARIVDIEVDGTMIVEEAPEPIRQS